MSSGRCRQGIHPWVEVRPGRALLFGYLRRAAPEKTTYLEPIERLLTPARQQPHLEETPSLYQGLAGVLWSAEHLLDGLGYESGSDLSDGPCLANRLIAKYLERITDKGRRSSGFEGWSGHYDLVSGLTGLGVFALERPYEPCRRELIEAIVGWLDAHAEHLPDGITWRTPNDFVLAETGRQSVHPVYNLGVAHGVPGIIAFLGRVYSWDICRSKAAALLPGAIQWLLSQQREGPDGLHFPYFAGKDAETTSAGPAWCYGVPGVAAAIHLAGRCTGETLWLEKALELARAAALVPVDPRGMEPGLCHGAVGVAHLFNRLYQVSLDPILETAAQSWFEAALCLRKSGEGIAGFPSADGNDGVGAGTDDASFLTGSAGIGLALLAAVTPIEPEWDAALLISGLAKPPLGDEANAPRHEVISLNTKPAGSRRPSVRGLYKPAEFFVLRTPLLPYDHLAQMAEDLTADAADGESALEAAMCRDRMTTALRLRETLRAPAVREAVWLASPSLYSRLDGWHPGADNPADSKLERALLRYVTRMCSRPTPFGLFAGCSLGRIEAQTNLPLGSRADYRKHTSVSIDVLQRIGWSVSKDRAFDGLLTYRVNPTLCRNGGKLVFFASRKPPAADGYELVVVEATELVERVITGCGASERFSALVEKLEVPDSDRQANGAFVRQMIEAQILLADIDPFVTGPDALKGLIDDLRQSAATSELTSTLEFAADEIKRLDQAPFGVDPLEYESLLAAIHTLPEAETTGVPFHTILVKPSPGATLGTDVIDSLAEGVRALQQCNAGTRVDPLLSFRDAFHRRYGTNTVRLTDLFQPQPDATPLLQGLTFTSDEGAKPSWRRHDSFLLRRLESLWAKGEPFLNLGEAGLNAISEGDLAPLPKAFAVIATVLDPHSAPDGLQACRTLLHAVSGPGGAGLLGRFCDADPALCKVVRALLAQEEALSPAAQFAEIVYMPAGRPGNVIRRPVLRDYEIVISGRAGSDPDKRIPVTDILVSIDGDRVRLWSAALNREIIPRLSNAHVPTADNLLLYRFLNQVQCQDSSDGLVWDWGPFECCEHLPRVVTGRTILARARWTVQASELDIAPSAADADLYTILQRWRRTRQIPRQVAIVEGDSELLVDLCNIVSLRSLLHAIRKSSPALLMEVIDGPYTCAVAGPEGRYTNEIVVPFLARRPDFTHLSSQPPEVHRKTIRHFTLGSEWLSVCIYTNALHAEHLIEELIAPLGARLLKTGRADRWFFVRYGDPDWHVRVRFHGIAKTLLHEVTPEIQRALAGCLDDGHVYRITFDTYQREIERYGGLIGVELSERVFHADSEAAASLLGLIRKTGAEDCRWRVALLAVDALLQDFGFGVATKLEIAEEMALGFGIEFGSQSRLTREIAEKYRTVRRDLETLLENGGPEDEKTSAAKLILGRRSERIRLIAKELMRQRAEGRIGRPMGELAASYAHMSANRILRESHRRQELVLYEFLVRLYRSQLAREGAGSHFSAD